MPKCVVYSGNLKHEECSSRTDYLLLKNAEGDDDSDGVRLKKIILYPKGVKLGRAAATASVTDTKVSFDLFARRVPSTTTAVRIAHITLDEGRKGAQETELDVDFPTDTIVVRGEYASLSFKLEADPGGKEVQFQYVSGDEQPLLELIEDGAEEKKGVEGNEKEEKTVREEGTQDVEMKEEESEKAPEEVKEEEEPKSTVTEETPSEETGASPSVKEEKEGDEGDEERATAQNEMKEGEVKEEVEGDPRKGEEEDRLSISSAVLEMEDAVEMTKEEAQAMEAQKAEEKRLKREQEDREAMALERDDDFSVEQFTPVTMKCRRPPWRERASLADAKAWELFCDAVSTFAHAALDSVIDDWVVTMENLLPALKGSLREAATNGLPSESSSTDLPLLMAEWARFGLCLDRAEGQPSPAAFLRVGLGVVEQVAGYSFEPRFGKALLEQGIAWDIVNVITETTFSALQTDALHALHMLQSCRGVSLVAAEVFFRFEKAVLPHLEEEEGEKKELNGEGEPGEEASIYDSIALLVAQTDETGETTGLLDLALRMMSRANLNAAALRLTRACAALVDVQGAAEKEVQEEASESLRTFIELFHKNDDLVRAAGHEGEALRTYGLLAECDWAGISCILLSRLKEGGETARRLLRFTLHAIDEQECVGLFALAESPTALQKLLIKQLLLVGGVDGEEEEQRRMEQEEEEGVLVFNETPSLAERLSGREVATRMALRLTALHWADRLAQANAGLSVENLDDEGRLEVLHAMLRMTVTEEGEAALGWVLSECAYSQLAAIVLIGCEEKQRHEKLVRASVAYGYAMEIMKVVARKARRGRFWTRNGRLYQKMVKNNALSPVNHLHQWWEPFSEAVIAGGETGSHSTITAIKNRLRQLADKFKDGEPPLAAISLLRVLATLIEPARALTRVANAARLESVSFCLIDGIGPLVEVIVKTALEYRMTLWTLGTSIEGTDAEAFRELVLAAYGVLRVLYSEQLKEGKSAKGVSVNAAGYAVGLWALTTGVTKARSSVGRHGRELRRALLAFLRVVSARGGEHVVAADWFDKAAATRVLRRMMDYAKDRMLCQPAALALLCYLLPTEGERGSETEVAVMTAVRESASPIAIMLLNYAPYAREVARAVFERLCVVLDRETFSALVRSIVSHVLSSFTTRPRKSVGVVDAEDVPVRQARERQRRIANVFSEMCTRRRFLLTLLERLQEDEQAAGRLQLLLEVYASTSNSKHTCHSLFLEEFASVLGMLADPAYYEMETVEKQGTEEGGSGEKEEPKVDEDEFMEDTDDRDCVTLEDVEEVEEETKVEETVEEDKLDIPLRVCVSLVRAACSPFSSCGASLSALSILEGLIEREDELAVDTVKRAWLYKQPTARALLQKVTTLLGEESEEAEELLLKAAEHLEKLFGSSEEGARELHEILEVGAGEEKMSPSKGTEGRRAPLRPLDDLMGMLKEKGKEEKWAELVEKAEGAGEEKVSLPARAKVSVRPSLLAELGDSKWHNEETEKFSLIVRVPPSSYENIALEEYARLEMEKYSRKGRVAEDRLAMAERNAGVHVKKPETPREKKTEEKKAEKSSSSEKKKAAAPKTPASSSSSATAKKTTPVTKKKSKSTEKKGEETIPNKIQPAVVPSRPVKRNAPTSVPKAGIKRRR